MHLFSEKQNLRVKVIDRLIWRWPRLVLLSKIWRALNSLMGTPRAAAAPSGVTMSGKLATIPGISSRRNGLLDIVNPLL